MQRRVDRLMRGNVEILETVAKLLMQRMPVEPHKVYAALEIEV